MGTNKLNQSIRFIPVSSKWSMRKYFVTSEIINDIINRSATFISCSLYHTVLGKEVNDRKISTIFADFLNGTQCIHYLLCNIIIIEDNNSWNLIKVRKIQSKWGLNTHQLTLIYPLFYTELPMLL